MLRVDRSVLLYAAGDVDVVAVPHRHLLELLPVVGATSLGGLALGEVGGEVIRVRVLDLGGPGSSGRCSSCRGSSGGRHVRGHGGSAGAAPVVTLARLGIELPTCSSTRDLELLLEKGLV